jgi:hypothetical protein
MNADQVVNIIVVTLLQEVAGRRNPQALSLFHYKSSQTLLLLVNNIGIHVLYAYFNIFLRLLLVDIIVVTVSVSIVNIFFAFSFLSTSVYGVWGV